MTDLAAAPGAAAPATSGRAPDAVPTSLDRRDPGTGLVSALYEGTLHHARLDATRHGFSYDVLMAYLALEELPGALDAHPLWSARHAAPIRFRREDFHGSPGVPLEDAVRHTVAEQTGRRPTGPIRLLAHLRTWGWSFNPIAFYFVLTPDGTEVDTLVAEVTNTPWHERHAYVLPVGAAALAEARFAKALHVSPFMDLDLDHSLRSTEPGAERLTIGMDDWRGDERTFAATLRLHRLPLDRATMGAALRRHPLPAQKVSAGIYWEALKLRAKGAPFRRHPGPVDGSTAAAPGSSSGATCPVHHPNASTTDTAGTSRTPARSHP
ncbi:DUF1365 domain-containing protein [Aquihabitans sp. G128]|uniref:DUF1365 domain-containing protein n=1 Tax=Aquihabitans sp. G128 TaxID=2849779 RepID=UPI001C212EB7|nr:DUF1365 domain-containing protein [Aquihabitans sp. G128]QXC62981.1 DUF1365 domain-containing protein [Aquihabitans sp. G128]